jgi:hypothetical protein
MITRTPNYEERYCAFIDILGFRNLVKGLHSASDATTLRDVMRKIHAPASGATVSPDVDFRAQSISDAIAISTTPMGLYKLLDAIERLAIDLLREGYFIRGALVRGNLTTMHRWCSVMRSCERMNWNEPSPATPE